MERYSRSTGAQAPATAGDPIAESLVDELGFSYEQARIRAPARVLRRRRPAIPVRSPSSAEDAAAALELLLAR
jgi:hypothetical protein